MRTLTVISTPFLLSFTVLFQPPFFSTIDAVCMALQTSISAFTYRLRHKKVIAQNLSINLLRLLWLNPIDVCWIFLITRIDILSIANHQFCPSIGLAVKGNLHPFDDSVNHVMEIMTENRFRHLPVINDGELLGIISIGDVVKLKIEQAEQDARDMRDYIAS